MKVAGFTFIRNAVIYDYPIVEAITSILPICDEFIVALGNSEDATEELIKTIGSPKIKIIHTVWDDSLRKGGNVLAVETDKAMDAISADTDWCFYIQGDEVVHEKYLNSIKEEMERNLNDKKVEGLLFNYTHFYGSYGYYANSRSWYRHEIRIFKNHLHVRSYKDAQGFRIGNRKLHVKKTDASIYHYGWVKNPLNQMMKTKNFQKYWHDDQSVAGMIPKIENFDYSEVDSLDIFKGSNPKVMTNRIARQNWQFEFDIRQKKLSFKKRLLHFVEEISGWRVGEYKNYKIIR